MPTLGQRAAAALKAAKAARSISWDEVAEIIDRSAVPPADKADSAAFGDRRKIPPTPEQVTAYSAHIGYPMDGQAWCDAYAAKGWKVGRERMKDWQAACRNWKTHDYGRDGIALRGGSAGGGRDYSKIG